MDKLKNIYILKNSKIYRACLYIFPLILLLYPLRHINMGLDLADTGYHYANFRYWGLEHMDSMWFFSTYLTNIVGHILTFLPGGHTLLFMNLYTGLFVSALALISYRFLTKRMGIPEIIAFAGEFMAISLCWAPTAALYNYMTYTLFLVGVLLVYEGLTQEKERYLIIAGAALGTNIFVRFSNLMEAGLIVAVWAYGVICHKKIKKVIRETGFCILGYIGAVIIWLGYISLRYGLASYVEGIKRLFTMSETATDYKVSSMIYGMFSDYIENLYWLNRILVFMVPGVIVCFVLPKTWKWIKRLVCIIFSAVAVLWLYRKNYFDFQFNSDGVIYRLGVIFLMLAIFVCILRIFSKDVGKEEKLLAGMIILVSIICSIGSNNRLLTSINNLFLVLPYVLWNMYKLCRKNDIRLFAIKTMGVTLLCLFFVQSVGFGVRYVFAETERDKALNSKIENNTVLKGIYTTSDKAEPIEELSAYVAEQNLAGKEVILYGGIPALSFYLEMPFCFNPWGDLESYDEATMTLTFDEFKRELSEGAELPVVILNRELDAYAEKDAVKAALKEAKLSLILEYMEEYGYTETFSNEKFVLYEAENN
ncbi:MAG: hypothetical protein NC433_10065 [Clostridiales bacterium]|nr:hypothetical protein [Clostridiales bacterium]